MSRFFFLGLNQIEKSRLAAIDDNGKQITYGELVKNASGFSDKIPARSIVFFLSHNSVGALNAYISMVANDIVPVMLNADIDRQLLDDLIHVYHPQFLCLPSENAERHPYNAVFECAGYTYQATRNASYAINDALQLLMTTSGSTGSPKLVRYKKGNLETNAKNVAKAWKWDENERPICDLKMNYTMGLNVINTHLYVGATLLMVSKNITDRGYWQFIKENRATNFTGVPFSYDILWKLRFQRMDLPHLTTLSEGGGKLTDEMFEKIALYAEENGKRFVASFGTTETSARLSMLDADMAMKKTGSIGKAIPGGKLYLIDNEGNEITESNTEGELVYEGPNVTMGYATSRDDLMKDDEFQGVYHTGDIAYRDSDGYYFIVGRKSRFLKMLGYRVSLDQCERLIREEFGIECACGGTDKQMRIFLTDIKKENEIKHFISEKTGIYTSMFTIINVPEIPRNSSGKIIYKALET